MDTQPGTRLTSDPELDTVDTTRTIDIGMAARFLARLDTSTDRFQFRAFPDKKAHGARRGAATKLCGTLAECTPELVRLNEQGCGVFVVVNAGGQRTADIDRVRALFVDLDGADIQPVLGFNFPPHMVVETSPSHFHAYWLVEGASVQEFSTLQRALAERFDADRNVCDLPRVMRLPGFLHGKSTPRIVKLLETSNKEAYSAAIFRGGPPVSAKLSARGAVRFASDQTIAELRSAIATLDADSRDVWVANAHRLKELGPIGLGLWLEWSAKSAKYDPSEAMRVWDTACPTNTGYEAVFLAAQEGSWKNPRAKSSVFAVGEQPRGIIKFTRIGDLRVNPIPWLIKGWLPMNSLGALVAQPGVGKTLLALDWAACIAAGIGWNGHAVKQGAVFYLAGEGGAGLVNRLTAWQQVNGVSLNDAPLFISDGLPSLCDPANVDEIVRVVRNLVAEHGPPALIVIDTLARAFGGENENDTCAMNKYVQALDEFRRQFGAAVLSVHHTGHEGRPTGRGSTALIGAMDMSVFMQDTKFGVQLSSEKAKDWSAPASKIFRIEQIALPMVDEDGDVVTSAVLTPFLTAITPERCIEVSDARKKEALARYAAGVSSKELAAELGIRPSTLSSWITKAGIARQAGRPRKQAAPSVEENGPSPMPGP